MHAFAYIPLMKFMLQTKHTSVTYHSNHCHTSHSINMLGVTRHDICACTRTSSGLTTPNYVVILKLVDSLYHPIIHVHMQMANKVEVGNVLLNEV